MSLADRITLYRTILAPVFFIVYTLPVLFPGQFAGSAIWNVPLLWIIAVVSELTDMFDGMAARRYKQTSDFGKLFDPFADTLMQVTCFLCFVIDGILPAALFLVVLYREFGIMFIRNLMLKKGIAMGARISGKVKTVTYIIAGAAALIYASMRRLAVLDSAQPIVKISANVIFGISALFSVISFFDYLSVYKSTGKAEHEK